MMGTAGPMSVSSIQLVSGVVGNWVQARWQGELQTRWQGELQTRWQGELQTLHIALY